MRLKFANLIIKRVSGERTRLLSRASADNTGLNTPRLAALQSRAKRVGPGLAPELIPFILLSVIVLAPTAALARIGVGVGVGKVELKQPLKAGGIYELPVLPVINTGDEAGHYEVGVQYHEGVPELRPKREWFKFEPSSFYLEPGAGQIVNISMTLPLKTEPGDYFAYLEGRPVKKSSSAGGTTIGVAAAAKLYFKIKPANIFQGIYYRVAALLNRYTPWTYVAAATALLSLIIIILKRYVKFNIGIARR